MTVEADHAAVEQALAAKRRWKAEAWTITHGEALGSLGRARESFEVIVVDPPRAGIGLPLARALAGRPPRLLLYVSCETGDAGARPGRARGRGSSCSKRAAVRSVSPHSSGRSGRGALRLRRGLSEAVPGPRAAPAAAAAAFFTAGILLGARSVTGSSGSAGLAGCCLLLLVCRSARDSKGAPSLAAFALLWASLGFVQARARIVAPAMTARASFAQLDPRRDRAIRVEGVLTDFWSGSPPHVTGRLRAERLWIHGSALPFPADVFLFVAGDLSPERVADRGDRILAVGHLIPEDLPASTRDISMPWPQYRLSIKSPMLIERSGRTLMSRLTLPEPVAARAAPGGGIARESLRPGRAGTALGPPPRENFGARTGDGRSLPARGPLPYARGCRPPRRARLRARHALPARPSRPRQDSRRGLPRDHFPVRPRRWRPPAGRARRDGLRDPPRDSPPGKADHEPAGDRVLGTDPLRFRPGAGLFDRHRADVRRGARHRAC